jgi:hypothetical protein
MDPTNDLSTGTKGIFIAAIVALAGVVAYLFKLNNERINKNEDGRKELDGTIADERKDVAVEREKWNLERERLRADYEAKNRELAEKYAKDLRASYEDNREHEDGVRKEFAEMMEVIATKAGESSQAIVTMLDKFYDRFIGPRRR